MDNKEVPKWLKLDNAAIIYPSTMTRKHAAMFRVSITLTEKVDKKILSKALKTTLKRIPSFSYRLKHGLFWYYFSYIDDVPSIDDDVGNPLNRFKWEDNKHFMFKVRCHESRISLDIFHALTDGMGAITFLLTLTAQYLKLKYGCNIEYDKFILNPSDIPHKEELEDSFKKYAKSEGSLDNEKSAYHLKGTEEEKHILNIITGSILLKDIKEECKKYDCTITEFLVSIMILSFQEIQEKEKSKRKRKKPIKITVPVNLRSIYPSKTLRNFSSYVIVGIDSKLGHYTLDEIVVQVKHQMRMLITEKRVNSKLTGNVKSEKNTLLRLIPMFIKKYLLLIAVYYFGDRYNTCNLSNLGAVKLPKEMSKYVNKVGVLIGRSKDISLAGACISYGDYLHITFSRKIKESEFERIFFKNFVEMGIPVNIESNQRR